MYQSAGTPTANVVHSTLSIYLLNPSIGSKYVSPSPSRQPVPPTPTLVHVQKTPTDRWRSRGRRGANLPNGLCKSCQTVGRSVRGGAGRLVSEGAKRWWWLNRSKKGCCGTGGVVSDHFVQRYKSPRGILLFILISAARLPIPSPSVHPFRTTTTTTSSPTLSLLPIRCLLLLHRNPSYLLDHRPLGRRS